MADEQKTTPVADSQAGEEKKTKDNPETSEVEQTKTEEKTVEVPAKFKSIVEEIEKMSVLDLSELVKILEDKFGVSASFPMAMAAVPGAADASGGAEEEKSEFDIELSATGENKINVIKVIREVTDKGLKEAKDMTEGTPVIVKKGVKKEEAQEIKKKLEEAGASVTLK
jgi:large subunit ribosomal protein L7/L12